MSRSRALPRSIQIEQFAEIEELQHKARERVLPLYRRSVYLGKTADGNERCYFTGHGLVSALWRRWAESAPDFANNVVFFRALMWLSHSAFDDLIPDWRLPKEAFGRRAGPIVRRIFAAALRGTRRPPGRTRRRHDGHGIASGALRSVAAPPGRQPRRACARIMGNAIDRRRARDCRGGVWRAGA